jgi:glutamine amidotransferase
MLAIVDYGAGNQSSVVNALKHLGIPCAVTDDPAILHKAIGVIFPGVGAAGQAMSRLRESGLDQHLRQVVAYGQPLLGICLGCQILLETSEENATKTLGILPGVSRRFDVHMREADDIPVPVPHMGWNAIRQLKPSPLLDGVDATAEFYFAHSYYMQPDPAYALALSTYGQQEFCSVCGRDGLWAVQFHPEKSGRPGLALLRNFFAYCEARHAQ